VCERFGLDPRGWDETDPRLAQGLLDYSAVREAEDQRELMAKIGASDPE